MEKVSLKLDWATHEAAKYACENWHYSGCIPAGKTVKVGAWENSKYIGVVIFARGASPYLLSKYALKQTEGCELARVALREHLVPVSRILSLSIKFLKKKNPGIRLVVSFADANKGHHGGIYQATNWIYSGASNEKVEYVDKNGRVWHDRQVTKDGLVREFGKLKQCPRVDDCVAIELKGKHRYLMPLDDEMRKQIEPLRKPYPKRAVSKDNVVSANHAEEGGVNPTTALQVLE